MTGQGLKHSNAELIERVLDWALNMVLSGVAA